ncbi:YlqD family protein [Pelosinus sp. sgz500959]|uniref:YlqD family protein n=1 Tax=Pelosinus sp. sgz500959 TaxID=3242472 RepID=UPI00366C79E7
MDTITLKCPIMIKSKVTEDLKQKLIADLQDGLNKVEMELQQLSFHAKRMMDEQAELDAEGLPALRQHIEVENQKRFDYKNQLVAKLKETEQLEIGAEISQGNLEQIVTLKVGDNLHDFMSAEILLEDGKIIAFRN